MLFINAIYPNENFEMIKGDIEIDDGIIKRVGQNLSYTKSETVIDCEEFYIVPGFVDIHVHGTNMVDASDGDTDGVLKMAKHLMMNGVTTFCPTVMSLPQDEAEKAIISIKNAKEKQEDGAFIAGINLEGFFISKEKKGAQKENTIITPDPDLFKHFNEISGGILKIANVAPEVTNGMEFVKEIKEICTVSIAHTGADYDTAMLALQNGATQFTHLFNAMTGLHHREPGVVGAFLDSENANAEIVCDGHHVHPAVVRTMFKYKPDDMIVISDSMRLAGCEDGETGDLGGQEVTINNGIATLKNGTIAGSATNMHSEFLNLLEWGVPLNKALKALTYNPAKAIGMDKEIGSLVVGKKADMLVLDSEYNICAVYH